MREEGSNVIQHADVDARKVGELEVGESRGEILEKLVDSVFLGIETFRSEVYFDPT